MNPRIALRSRTRLFVGRLRRANTSMFDLAPARAAAVFAVGRSCLPPAYAKRAHLLRLFHERAHTVFVESGTYLGDTAALFAEYAEQVISVELHDELWRLAAERFAGTPNVDIRHGDATDVVPEVVARLAAPPLIWLDGHYSGEGTAAGSESEPAATIIERLGLVCLPGCTLVIDDLRLFGTPGYACLDELIRSAALSFPAARVRTGLDSLVIEV